MSQPPELPRWLLAEPDVTLSRHPAPIRQTFSLLPMNKEPRLAPRDFLNEASSSTLSVVEALEFSRRPTDQCLVEVPQHRVHLSAAIVSIVVQPPTENRIESLRYVHEVPVCSITEVAPPNHRAHCLLSGFANSWREARSAGSPPRIAAGATSKAVAKKLEDSVGYRRPPCPRRQ